MGSLDRVDVFETLPDRDGRPSWVIWPLCIFRCSIVARNSFNSESCKGNKTVEMKRMFIAYPIEFFHSFSNEWWKEILHNRGKFYCGKPYSPKESNSEFYCCICQNGAIYTKNCSKILQMHSIPLVFVFCWDASLALTAPGNLHFITIINLVATRCKAIEIISAIKFNLIK